MSKRQNVTIGAIGYALLALIAFGHSAAAGHKAYVETGCDRYPYNSNRKPAPCVYVPDAFAAGLFWPLYLSWDLQS